jgi:hypothetical protein
MYENINYLLIDGKYLKAIIASARNVKSHIAAAFLENM